MMFPIYCIKYFIYTVILIHETQSQKLMRAAVMHEFGSMDVLKIEEVPVPTISSNQVLVNVKAAGINPIDIYLRSGTHYLKPNLPVILGKEISGIVEEVDEDVSTFKKDDRVFCFVEQGGYAEYAAANASTCHHLPQNKTFQQGAALYITYLTAYRGLIMKGKLEKDDNLLIHGASGTMGTAAIQIAKAIGAFTVATVGEEEFEELMLSTGADSIVYHNERDYLKTSLTKINRPGYDVIFEIVSKLRINNDKKYLVHDGQIVVVGNRVSIWPNETSVSTVSLFKYQEEEQVEASKAILDFCEKGFINPVIKRVYPLDDISKAHLDVSYNDSAKGKLVIEMVESGV